MTEQHNNFTTTVYATVIRDCQDFWDYPTDLIGVYPSRKSAEQSLIIWLQDFGFDDILSNTFAILNRDQKDLTNQEQWQYDDADKTNQSISIVPIEFGSYIDIDQTNNDNDIVNLKELLEEKQHTV